MEESKVPETRKEKSNKEVFLDYFNEIVGVEKGFYRTLVDLRKQPRQVVHGYLANEGTYTSPFKLLISIASLWLLVNNLIIDWYTISENLLTKYLMFSRTHFEGQSGPMPERGVAIIKVLSHVMEELISKYFLVYVLISTPLLAWLCYLLCRKFHISFRTHFTVVAYHFSFMLIPSLLFTWCVAINFWFAIIVTAIIGLSKALRLGAFFDKIYVVVPVRDFFGESGSSIARRYFFARFLRSLFFVLIIVPIYIYYLKNAGFSPVG